MAWNFEIIAPSYWAATSTYFYPLNSTSNTNGFVILLYYVFPVILEYWKPVELYYSSVKKWVAKVVLGLQPKEEVRLRQNFKDQDQLQLVYPHCLEVSTNQFF